MKRSFKLKINGECPRSLFLAYYLANYKCNVYLFDFTTETNSKIDEQIISFTNFSKNLLIQFGIWNEFKAISYSYDSLCFYDFLISEKLIILNNNLLRQYCNNIGWTASYSDIKSLLIKKLINFDNVYFVPKNMLLDKSFIFDYEFNFNDNTKILNQLKLPLSFSNIKDDHILIFNVYLADKVEKRLYEINTTEGLIVLTPLEKNLYQLIWNNVSIPIKKSCFTSKSFFLDNLTTLLPNELKIDQIIGEIKSLNVSKFSPNYIIKNKSLFFNDIKYNSNILYDFNFDIFIRYIIQIFNSLEKDKSSRIKVFNKIRFYYILKKYLEFIIDISRSNYLINLFTFNNKMLLYIRKLLFILSKRINILKKFLIKNLIYFNMPYFIKKGK